MKKIFAVIMFVSLILTLTGAHAGWNPVEREEDEQAAKSTIDNFIRTDPSLKTFIDKAYGYAVLPTIGKGAYIIGVGYGKGLFYESGKSIGKVSVKQLSAGAQIGGQTYSEIIFFKDKERAEEFKFGQFELGAQLSAVVVTTGAGTAATYTNGVAVFILPKAGLMVDASVGGQQFSFEPFEK